MRLSWWVMSCFGVPRRDRAPGRSVRSSPVGLLAAIAGADVISVLCYPHLTHFDYAQCDNRERDLHVLSFGVQCWGSSLAV
jgi:hypothetical protein